ISRREGAFCVRRARTCADVAAGISQAHRRRAHALGGSSQERRHQSRMRLAGKTMVKWLGTAIALGFSGICGAQPAAYPNKPIRLIVPYAPGGVADLLSRI